MLMAKKLQHSSVNCFTGLEFAIRSKLLALSVPMETTGWIGLENAGHKIRASFGVQVKQSENIKPVVYLEHHTLRARYEQMRT